MCAWIHLCVNKPTGFIDCEKQLLTGFNDMSRVCGFVGLLASACARAVMCVGGHIFKCAPVVLINWEAKLLTPIQVHSTLPKAEAEVKWVSWKQMLSQCSVP